MDWPDGTFFAVAVPAVAFAGVSKGGFGSGAAFAASSILALIVAPGQALGIMLPLLLLIDMVSLPPYWRKWSGRDAAVLVLGGVPGVVLGAALYRVADADMIRLLIGVICLAFVAHQVARAWGLLPVPQRRLPVWVGLLTGLGAGFTSFVSHAGGPVAAVYLLGQGLGKTTYQATTVLSFWAVNVMKFAVYAWLGIFTAQTFALGAVLAPFAVLGTWLGVVAHRHVPERPFFALTYALLLATGCKLIWDALGPA